MRMAFHISCLLLAARQAFQDAKILLFRRASYGKARLGACVIFGCAGTHASIYAFIHAAADWAVAGQQNTLRLISRFRSRATTILIRALRKNWPCPATAPSPPPLAATYIDEIIYMMTRCARRHDDIRRCHTRARCRFRRVMQDELRNARLEILFSAAFISGPPTCAARRATRDDIIYDATSRCAMAQPVMAWAAGDKTLYGRHTFRTAAAAARVAAPSATYGTSPQRISLSPQAPSRASITERDPPLARATIFRCAPLFQAAAELPRHDMRDTRYTCRAACDFRHAVMPAQGRPCRDGLHRYVGHDDARYMSPGTSAPGFQPLGFSCISSTPQAAQSPGTPAYAPY